MGFLGKNTALGVPFPPPGGLPDPGIEPGSPPLQADSLRLRHQGRLRAISTGYELAERIVSPLSPPTVPPASPTLIKSILLSFHLMSGNPFTLCTRTMTILFGKVLDAQDKRITSLRCVCLTQDEVGCFPHWSSRPPTDTLSNISSIQQRYQLPLPGLSTEPGL